MDINMGKNTAPLYRFVHEESRQILFSATDIDGFFIDSEAHESGVILAREASLEKSVDKPLLERVEVEVLKFDGKVIGSYYVGQIEVIGSRSQEEAGYDWGLLLNLSGYGIPYPYAREIWPQWATGSPTAPGRWSTYPPEAHQSWLHVVQQVWFTADHRARRYRRE
ncbi:hypothetical protein, partial [Sinosporangium album]|uniref:hypothetical protein n=1 Tax=Sinosporangium album TaxID=504805 RepID=UPI001C40A445